MCDPTLTEEPASVPAMIPLKFTGPLSVMTVLTSVEINRLIRKPDFFRNVFLKSTSILTAIVLQMLVGMRLDI